VGVREAHLQERFRTVAGDCRRCARECRRRPSSEPTGGLRPPLLVHGVRSASKWRFLRCTNAHSQERRASARRGTVNRTPCRRNHALCSDYATQNQERRASARRGFGRSSVAHGVWRVPQITCKRVSRTTAGARPPLLVAMRTLLRMRISHVRDSHGGLCRWHDCRSLLRRIGGRCGVGVVYWHGWSAAFGAGSAFEGSVAMLV
jgi:hypothetical protein